MKLTELITLLKAGYSKKEIDALVKAEEEAQKEPEEKPEPQPEKEPEPQPEEESEHELEPDYKALYEQSMKALESAQAHNRAINNDNGSEKTETAEEIILNILGG